MADQVDEQSAAISAMATEWPQIDALMGGTRMMRSAGERLLPRWPAEEPKAYDARLAQATLFPAYSRTIAVMSGKPFSRQLTLAEETPEQIRAWCDDIDRQGSSLHVFAAGMFNDALAWGFAGILVDTPRAVGLSASPTRAEQASAGMRPYFVGIKHNQVLGYRVSNTADGLKLTQLRIKEDSNEPDGEFGEKKVERVRVLEAGKWTLYRKGEREYTREDSGTTGVDFIPFVPLYGLKRDFMVGAPPLLDLAYQNVEHWQSKSDQQNILHVARVPILAMYGVDEKTELVVGGSSAIKFTQPYTQARMEFVEHTGDAIDAGRQSLLDVEGRMIATGAELLVAKPGQRTATESANDAEANKSDLQRIVEHFEDSLDIALSYMAQLGGQDDTCKVTLFKDFAATSLSDASAQLVREMVTDGIIRKETAIKEWQRRGVLSADIDAVDEPKAAQDEQGTPPGGDPDDGGDPLKGDPDPAE